MKIIFVPAGEDPSFEVTENTESMLYAGETVTSVAVPVINLDGMTATKLREFADENNIDVPGNLKKPDTIREYIEEQLATERLSILLFGVYGLKIE